MLSELRQTRGWEEIYVVQHVQIQAQFPHTLLLCVRFTVKILSQGSRLTLCDVVTVNGKIGVTTRNTAGKKNLPKNWLALFTILTGSNLRYLMTSVISLSTAAVRSRYPPLVSVVLPAPCRIPRHYSVKLICSPLTEAPTTSSLMNRIAQFVL